MEPRAARRASVVGSLDDQQPCNKGDVIIVMEPAAGVGATVSRYLQDIRDMAPADPDAPVLTPGDRARATRERRAREGLAITAQVWGDIVQFAQREPALRA
jgi:LDH2 family malate/lactate/ureidoglycolate dehydrogenase